MKKGTSNAHWGKATSNRTNATTELTTNTNTQMSSKPKKQREGRITRVVTRTKRHKVDSGTRRPMYAKAVTRTKLSPAPRNPPVPWSDTFACRTPPVGTTFCFNVGSRLVKGSSIMLKCSKFIQTPMFEKWVLNNANCFWGP